MLPNLNVNLNLNLNLNLPSHGMIMMSIRKSYVHILAIAFVLTGFSSTSFGAPPKTGTFTDTLKFSNGDPSAVSNSVAHDKVATLVFWTTVMLKAGSVALAAPAETLMLILEDVPISTTDGVPLN